jgi:hypothetical protein
MGAVPGQIGGFPGRLEEGNKRPGEHRMMPGMTTVNAEMASGLLACRDEWVRDGVVFWPFLKR